MALTLIEQARLYIYDLPANEQFYPLFTDEEWQFFLDQANDDPLKAARSAAKSSFFKFATLNSKEKYGDVEAWNNAYQSYKDAVYTFANDTSLFGLVPNGAMPYAAGVSVSDLEASRADVDNPRVGNTLYEGDKQFVGDCYESCIEVTI